MTSSKQPAHEEQADWSNFVEPQFFTDALKVAEAEGKPIVLDFMASWCAPCKRLDQETFADPDVANQLKKCVFLKIDTDEYPGLAGSYGVSSLPDIRLLTPNGSQHSRLSGFQDAESMSKELRRLLYFGGE